MGDEGVLRANSVIRICGDVDIVVPDQVQLMTTYVLREQEDWFEDEIKFLRSYLRAGMHAVDIGANYGLYALSIARCVGENGRVIAVEPTSATAAFLRAGVSHNGFRNVEVVQSALSNRAGTAQLHLSANSELNALSVAAASPDSTETVELTTLDLLAKKCGLDRLDFLKIDAEGEEQRIIEGGLELLRRHSPLIMYEIKAGNSLNLDIVADFSALGYDSYRLLPGLELLVPAEASAGVDSYQLNFFCCKSDRTDRLCRDGILVARSGAGRDASVADRGFERIAQLPFARPYRDKWLRPGIFSGSRHDECAAVLRLYAAAHDKLLSPAQRYAALRAAHRRMGALCEGTQNAYRLGTFARIAWELGQRAQAVEALARAFNGLAGQSKAHAASEPFLPANRHFDVIDPGGREHQWLIASILDQLLSLASFSSYFAHTDNLKHFEFLKESGFQRPEMERRRQLIRLRAGLQTMPERSIVLAESRPDNLNPSFWSTG